MRWSTARKIQPLTKSSFQSAPKPRSQPLLRPPVRQNQLPADMIEGPGTLPSVDASNELHSLRSLLQLSVVAMLITTTAVALYFGWQYRQLSRELNSRAATLQEIPKVQERLNTIAEKFREFGRTYPEFAEICKKYGINPYDKAPAPAKP